jgi:hypothetical protein
MSIRPGTSWGREVPRPDGLVVVDDDAAFVRAISVPVAPPVAVGSGDLARTLGVRGVGSVDRRSNVNEFPIDLLHVRLDDAAQPITACAHVIVRSPWSRGHLFRGRILAIMNAEFIGEWDVAPRGHPNDGRMEVLDVDASMSVRHRLAARRRLPAGTHVPHPRVSTRSVRTGTWSFARPVEVVVDGRRFGRASSLAVDVVPDAATVYA